MDEEEEERPLKPEISFQDEDEAIAGLGSFHVLEATAPGSMEGLPAGSSSTLPSQSLLRAHVSSRVVTATSEATMADEESEHDSVRTGESRELPEEQQLQDLAHLDLIELRSLVRENRCRPGGGNRGPRARSSGRLKPLPRARASASANATGRAAPCRAASALWPPGAAPRQEAGEGVSPALFLLRPPLSFSSPREKEEYRLSFPLRHCLAAMWC